MKIVLKAVTLQLPKAYTRMYIANWISMQDYSNGYYAVRHYIILGNVKAKVHTIITVASHTPTHN